MTKNKKILIVDDIPDNREVIKLALRHFECEFIEARDGEEGVEKALSEHPDLIIMDLLMPIKNGFDAIKELRNNENTYRLPILVLTAYDESSNKIRALDLGATDFLTKPFDKTELQIRVSSLLEIYGKFFDKERELLEINDKLEDMVWEKSLKLMEKSYRDDLTGVYNRSKLISDIGGLQNISALMLDIDNFGELNNLYGNDIGDEILKQFAKRLQKEFGDHCVYRTCADSFIVIIQYITDDTAVLDACKKLHTLSCSEPFFVSEGHYIYLSVAIGASKINQYPKEALTEADSALEQSKKQKKLYVIYTPNSSILDIYKTNIEWTYKINTALKEDRIVPVFQPIIDNKSKKIVKYESLIRIKDGDELISPFFFLDIAKKTKLYPLMTRIMIEKTFEKFKNMGCKFSINLSSEDISDIDTLKFILDNTSKFCDPSRIVYEILESEGIDNYELVSEFISDIKKWEHLSLLMISAPDTQTSSIY